MNNMVTFSDAALKHIEKIIQRTQGAAAFRLSIKQSGCSGLMYIPDVVSAPKDGDLEIITQQGLQVYIDPDCVEVIKDTRVDVVDKGLGQTQLSFNNPRAKSLCGCGESFHMDDEKN